MRVLIGCETSGVIRRAFASKGHEVWSADLLPADDHSAFHITCSNENSIFEIIARGWDLLIIHPTCTYLTNSAAWAFSDGPYHQKILPGTLVGKARRAAREHAITFCRRIVELPIERIAMENPIGALSSAIRKPDQIIQPYQFGNDASKATCLWLKNLPTLAPTCFVHPRMICRCGGESPYKAAHKSGCIHCGAEPAMLRPRWSNQTNSGQNKLTPSKSRWKTRSETFPGIADAMADQWGNL